MTNPNNTIAMVVSIEVSRERLRDLLTTAFETAQWARVEGYLRDMARESTDPFVEESKKEWCKYSWVPLAGGKVYVEDDSADEDEVSGYQLGWEEIEAGLAAFIEGNPYQFSEFMRQNEDADTADAFLQYCLFGTEVYA